MSADSRPIWLAMIAYVLALVLQSCYIPEEFDVVVELFEDGSSEVIYKGKVAHAYCLEQVSKGEPLSAKDHQSMADTAAKWRKSPEVVSVTIAEDCRYQVEIRKKLKIHERYQLLSKDSNFLTISYQQPMDHDLYFEVAGKSASASEIANLKSVGAKVTGTLVVKVPPGTEIHSHNADSEPSLWGYWGGYKWDLKDLAATPRILAKLDLI